MRSVFLVALVCSSVQGVNIKTLLQVELEKFEQSDHAHGVDMSKFSYDPIRNIKA